MKKIEAIIRKTKFEDVKEALLSSDIDWFEYHDVHGIAVRSAFTVEYSIQRMS